MSDPPSRDSAPLIDDFKAIFGDANGAVHVRAPGRANLIGEHVDYNGLPVLPMALDRHITLVARPNSLGQVRIHNLNPRFAEYRCEVRADLRPEPAGHWGAYVQAAVQALARRHGEITGADLLVASDLPAAAGLSSSSALVVAVALGLLAVNGLQEDPIALAAQMAEAERFVGLAGGGMDQAVCLGAQAGTASRVSFAPLRIEHHPIPTDWGFVVAHSLVAAEKSAGARATYNRRTEECRLALNGVGGFLGIVPASVSYPALLAQFDTEELLHVASRSLSPELEQRFRHVVTESARVDRVIDALEARDLGGAGDTLRASHASLRDDYAVSCEALDSLVDAALAGGAAGARLTGAGLGGCVLAVVHRAGLEDLLAALDDRFYAGRGGGEGTVRFAAVPSGGATVTPVG